jgi:hypothetical protein
MGFGTGYFAKVWESEDKGKYSIVNLSTSKKNKDTGEYTTDFSSKFVRFVGTAHERLKDLDENGRIKLGNCEVTINKSKEGKFFTDFTVFSFENASDAKSEPSAKPTENTKGGDDDLPY